MKYRPELDGLRALAVLAVIASHSSIAWTGGGWTGVDVFFVLSGYLITTLLLEENARSARISLRNFYTRRALRLYPALLAMILLGLPFYSLLGNGGTLPGYGQAALIAGTYVQDFVNGFIGDPQGEFGHTWSLAVEEQFYLIWPIALILMLKFRARLMPWTLVAAGLTTATLVTLSFQESADGISDRAYYLPWSRFSALLVGCVIAIALKRGVRPAVVRLDRSRFGGGGGGFCGFLKKEGTRYGIDTAELYCGVSGGGGRIRDQ